MNTVSNENGLSLTILIGNYDHLDPYIIVGGDPSNPSWQEYLESYKEEYHPHILLLKRSIEENGLLGYTGQKADDFTFQFSDGQTWAFTWRGWADLMSAIVDKKEGYIKYYI